MTIAGNPTRHQTSTVKLDKRKASTKLKFGLNF